MQLNILIGNTEEKSGKGIKQFCPQLLVMQMANEEFH